MTRLSKTNTKDACGNDFHVRKKIISSYPKRFNMTSDGNRGKIAILNFIACIIKLFRAILSLFLFNYPSSNYFSHLRTTIDIHNLN